MSGVGQAVSRARKHWLGWGAVFVIAVALGAVGVGHPLDWGIVVVVMAIFGYGLAALLRISLALASSWRLLPSCSAPLALSCCPMICRMPGLR